MPQVEPKLLQGFFDYTPKQMAIRQYVIEKWRNIFRSFGYGQLETPVLEYADVLMGKYGEEEKLIYHFYDHGERHIAMRYDQTVPFARFVAMNKDNLKFPYKRYEINRVWRAEAARRGRKREFYQCDIDIVGTESLMADAEILQVLHYGFLEFNLPKHVIHINHRKVLESFLTTLDLEKEKYIEVNRSIDKLDKVGIEGVIQEMKNRGINEPDISKIIEFISLKGEIFDILSFLRDKLKSSEAGLKAVSELEILFKLLNEMGINDKYLSFNPSLVRGLDYYTGAVFELKIEEFGTSALAGGGRYDNLCGIFLDDVQISGVGVAVGIERLCLLIEENNIPIKSNVNTQILVTVFADNLRQNSLEAADALRKQGINTEIYLENDKIAKQFKYADKNNIPFVLIIGEEEVKKEVVILKNMRNGNQSEVNLKDVLKSLETS